MFFRGTIESKEKFGYKVKIPEVGTVDAEVCKVKGVDIEYLPKEVVYIAKIGEDGYAIIGCLETNDGKSTAINTSRINASNGTIEKAKLGETDTTVLGEAAYYYKTVLKGEKKDA